MRLGMDLGMLFGRVLCVIAGMKTVCMRHVGVVGSLLVIARPMMPCRLVVVVGSLRVMMGRLRMMMRCFL